MLRNKRGEEFAEAAIVLPLVILTVISMITVTVFFFQCEVLQSGAHARLAGQAAASDRIFGISKGSAPLAGKAEGLFRGRLEQGRSFRMYVISQSDAIMLGELAE